MKRNVPNYILNYWVTQHTNMDLWLTRFLILTLTLVKKLYFNSKQLFRHCIKDNNSPLFYVPGYRGGYYPEYDAYPFSPYDLEPYYDGYHHWEDLPL